MGHKVLRKLIVSMPSSLGHQRLKQPLYCIYTREMDVASVCKGWLDIVSPRLLWNKATMTHFVVDQIPIMRPLSQYERFVPLVMNWAVVASLVAGGLSRFCGP